MSFLGEIKRHKEFQIADEFVVVSRLQIQVEDMGLPAFDLRLGIIRSLFFEGFSNLPPS